MLRITPERLQNVVVLDYGGQLAHYSTHCAAYRDLSIGFDSAEAARVLFSSLRWAETQPHATHVFIAPIIPSSDKRSSIDEESDMSRGELFFGLSDRIFRATSGESIEVILE